MPNTSSNTLRSPTPHTPIQQFVFPCDGSRAARSPVAVSERIERAFKTRNHDEPRQMASNVR